MEENDGDRVMLVGIVLCIMPWNIIVWSGCGCDRLLLIVACVDVECMLGLGVEGFWSGS